MNFETTFSIAVRFAAGSLASSANAAAQPRNTMRTHGKTVRPRLGLDGGNATREATPSWLIKSRLLTYAVDRQFWLCASVVAAPRFSCAATETWNVRLPVTTTASP